MGVSACMIAYNEEELLPCCLTFLESMQTVKEVICIVDQDTTDRTTNILAHYAAWSSKKVIWKTAPFQTFGGSRNLSIQLATEDWILIIDPDETYTPQTDELIKDLDGMPHINAVRVPTIVLWGDRRHYLSQETLGLDMHTRIWRRGFALFDNDIHEIPYDSSGRMLINPADPDILSTNLVVKYHPVSMKHMQLLKSDASLLEKGKRWQSGGLLEASARRGIPVKVNSWLDFKKWGFRQHKIQDLSENLYDITSDW